MVIPAACQSFTCSHYTQDVIYEWARKSSSHKAHPHLMRLMGLPLGIASAAVQIAFTITSIVEPLIKGLASFFICPFTAPFLRGLIFRVTLKRAFVYTFLTFPFNVVHVPYRLLLAVLDIFFTTFGMLFTPHSYAKWRALSHTKEWALWHAIRENSTKTLLKTLDALSRQHYISHKEKEFWSKRYDRYVFLYA